MPWPVHAGEATIKRTTRPPNVYVSYTPADRHSQTVAEYICCEMLRRHEVKCDMLAPDDGTLTYIDFEDKLKVRTTQSDALPELFMARKATVAPWIALCHQEEPVATGMQMCAQLKHSQILHHGAICAANGASKPRCLPGATPLCAGPHPFHCLHDQHLLRVC